MQIRVILTEDKNQTVQLKLKTIDKALSISEQIANLFSETKYSTTLFSRNKKINPGDKLSDLNLGYSH